MATAYKRNTMKERDKVMSPSLDPRLTELINNKTVAESLWFLQGFQSLVDVLHVLLDYLRVLH
jgi:hypothetical protein